MFVDTEESVGYQDAIRQVQRSIARRVKSLEEKLKEVEPQHKAELTARIDELHHITQIVESLHR